MAMAAAALSGLLTGCHSAMIQTTVHNSTGTMLQLIEVDYPSASFGTQGLASGGDFRYRFKVLGSGNVKIVYTDRSGKEQTATGPELREGLEGQLLINVAEGGVTWTPTTATLTPLRRIRGRVASWAARRCWRCIAWCAAIYSPT